MTKFPDSRYFIDNSRLIIEATVQAGADVFNYCISYKNIEVGNYLDFNKWQRRFCFAG